MKLDLGNTTLASTGATGKSKPSYTMDLLAAPFRGVEGLGHGIYNLADWVSFDLLPDWDEGRLFGKSETTPGMLLEGLVQFAVPFGAIGKGLSVAGKAARAGKATGLAGKTAKALTKKGTGKVLDLNWKGALATEMTTDFVAWDGQEQRLSNLIQQFPALQNPITEFLAADPNDNEAYGRAKNVVEGMLIGAGVTALLAPVMAGLRAIRKRKVELEAGASDEDAIISATVEHADAMKEARVGDVDELDDLYKADGVYKGMEEEFGEDGVKLMPDLTDGKSDDYWSEESVLSREIETDAKAIADEQDALNDMLKRVAEGEPVDEWRKGLREDRIEKFKGDLQANKEKLETLQNKGELQDRLAVVEGSVETFDEAIDARPPRQPFKTNLEAKRGLEGSRGAEYIKNRLQKKFPVKGADPDEVKDVEAFIDLIGEDMFSDVSLSITSKITSKGRFNFGNKLLEIRKSVVEGGSLSRTMVHELWHSLSRYLPKKDSNALTKQFNRERNKYIQSFGVIVKDVDKWDLQNIKLADQPKELKDFLNGKYNSKNYRFSEIDEYFAEEMTDAFLSKLDVDAALAPQGTFKRVAQDIAILFKHLFASVKSKLGIDQRQKIFNDFIKQRNVKKQRSGPLDYGFSDISTKKMQDFDATASPKVKKTIDNVNAKIKTGGEQAIKQTGSGLDKKGPTIEGGLRQDEMYEVMNQVGKQLDEQGIKPEKGSEKESLEAVGRQLAHVTGADGKTIEGQIAAAKNNPQKLKEIETNMGALRSLMGANAEDIVRFARQFSEGHKKLSAEDLEILEAQIKNAVEMQFNLQASVSQIASGFGRGLRATRYKARRIGLSTAELANERLRQEYLRKRGSLSTEEVVNKIILAADGQNGGDIWESLVNVNKAVRGMEGGKFMKMLRESYIGALLWGPRTWNINIIGNSIAGNMRQYERYVGGWLSAEPTVRRGVIDSMSYSIFSRDLWKFVSNVWRNGDSLLDAGGSSFKGDAGNERVVGAITGENVAQSIDAMRGTQGALEGADAFKTLIDYVGKAYRLPMKMLMSTDEMYKQLEFRRRATVQLWDKAVSRGMTNPKQISEYVYDTMEALVTSSGRHFSEASLVKEAQEASKNMKFESAVEREMFMADHVAQLRNEKLDFARQQGLVDSDNNINAMEQLAKEWVEPNLESARNATFTNELGSFSSKLAEVVEAAPMGWLVLPFIKAPTNILKFGFGRLAAPITAAGQAVLSKPFPGLADASDSFLNMLKSSDPIKRSEARGKLATGVVAWTALYSAISNTDKITGGGPLDARQNKAWRAAGFMPYSVKIGGKWISYQRLDPVATIVGTIADLDGVFKDHVHGFDKSFGEKAAAAGMVSLARNLTNKSYLSGINNFMQLMTEPEVKAESILGRTFAGFIPNVLNQGQSITGDQTIKESRRIMDDFLKKLPVLSDRVDLRRNVLGEAAKAEMFEGMGTEILNPFNPIAWSSKTNDPVLREMAYLHHGFSPPSHMLNRLVDLTAFTQSNGRTAYDRWLGLTSEVSVRNNTLRQALEKLIKSNQYQRLAPNSAPGLTSPRVRLLNNVISTYRQKALDQLFDEFPDIKHQYDQTVVAKRSLKQGGSFQDVLQLLNQ